MAEDEDGVSDKKSPQNSNNGAPPQENEQNASKPDLGIEEAKYNANKNDDTSPTEASSSSSKSSGAIRKEYNQFSFRHFLKRDLSLPGNSTYENTGARPKVYASTAAHSPARSPPRDSDQRRDKFRDSQPKDRCSEHRSSDNASSSSSVDMPFSVVDNSDSKHNFFSEGSEVPFYHRPNIASEPLGMPSLPDFVQDHILVEQAYLNPNGPISVDLDNLPDFTFNTSFNAGSSSSLGRRNNASYGGQGYFDSYMGAAAASDPRQDARDNIPLDLPLGAEGAAAAAGPLDLPPHLNLDLTESVNPADRRNNSPRNSFPLDLPPNSGIVRMPDFLPTMHPGRTSPEPEHQDIQLQQLRAELERTRSELFTERSRRNRAEQELEVLSWNREEEARLRAELLNARASETHALHALNEARQRDREYTGQLDAAAERVEGNLCDVSTRAAEAEATIAKLKNQIKILKEEAGGAQAEARALRAAQGGAARDLRRATARAETSLRELLDGVEQLKSLSTSLDLT